LTKARQALIERLGRRGLAPAIGGSLGLGLATATAEASHRLIDTVMSLIPAGGAVSPALVKLASGGLPMMMRTKLAAAVLVVAGGLSAVLFPMANAQVRNNGEPQAGFGSSPPPAPPAAPRPPQPPHTTASMAASGVSAISPHLRWEYKFVVGGFDSPQPPDLFSRLGDDGWEYCGSEPITPEHVKAMKPLGNIDVVDKKFTTAFIFKRAKGSRVPGATGTSPIGGIPAGAMNGIVASGIPFSGYPSAGVSPLPPAYPAPIARPGAKSPYDSEDPVDANRRVYGARPALPGTPALTTPTPVQEPALTTIRLKNADAAEVAQILEKVFNRDA